MKNTNFNRLLMVLMMSASVACASSRVEQVTVTKSSSPVVTEYFPVGLESHYDIQSFDDAAEYKITEVDKAHYRAEAAPVDFTIEAPSVLLVGENPEAPFMSQIDLAMSKFNAMEREEDAKDMSEVAFRIEMANKKIQALRLLEGNKKAYDRELREAKKELRIAEHMYRKATPGLRSKN